jgi:acetyl-CoA synthetase
LNAGVEPHDDLKRALVAHVRKEIGPIAAPDVIHWAPGLPKTRSGKIMRRILRKIAEGEVDALGDTSTLVDPGVVDELIRTGPRELGEAPPASPNLSAPLKMGS